MKKYKKKDIEVALKQIAESIAYCRAQLENLIRDTQEYLEFSNKIEALQISETLVKGGDGTQYSLKDLRKSINLAMVAINDALEEDCNLTKEIATAFVSEELCTRLIRKAQEEAVQCKKELEKLKMKYEKDFDLWSYEKGLHVVAHKYHENFSISTLFSNTGEELFREGKKEEGMAFIKAAMKDFDDISDEITLYLLAGQYYIEHGEIQEGKEYLLKLCTETAENYEEAIASRGLTDVWEAYCYLVEEQIEMSEKPNQPKPIEQCTMLIGDILKLPEDKMIIALSEHLDERTRYGDNLSHLNQWERNIYDVITLSGEVNSGGFDFYLTHHCQRFNQVRKALLAMGAVSMVQLLDDVQEKFPTQKIPSSMRQIEDVLEEMTMRGIDFEKEDMRYYDAEEENLMEKLYLYIETNRKKLR
ncbi:MAG: DMP19 family protein [Emergencia sp.]|jgi:hypothetical protein|uniref:DUF4375 domain-containing protein n=1 Tax=Anaerotruncus colihominis TaxID=169435 RepID=A0A845QQ77_9FIRM|nr:MULTISPECIES: DUF4375 domain-containing protein [Eubacteriales]MCI9474858.1 DMP19 family protein [Emergencia sp.]NBH62853.1 DUF4375 domain-containing protein [Anaerotruncus colihominis]NCF03507.1 DUF4375 domain-containing protein [Anaerotruncus sp. 80]